MVKWSAVLVSLWVIAFVALAQTPKQMRTLPYIKEDGDCLYPDQGVFMDESTTVQYRCTGFPPLWKMYLDLSKVLVDECSAFSTDPANCSAGEAAAGIAADGTAEGCFTPSVADIWVNTSGDVMSGPLFIQPGATPTTGVTLDATAPDYDEYSGTTNNAHKLAWTAKSNDYGTTYVETWWVEPYGDDVTDGMDEAYYALHHQLTTDGTPGTDHLVWKVTTDGHVQTASVFDGAATFNSTTTFNGGLSGMQSTSAQGTWAFESLRDDITGYGAAVQSAFTFKQRTESDASRGHTCWTNASNADLMCLSTTGSLDLAGTLGVADVGSDTSANWAGHVSNETGSGLWVFNDSPALTTPTVTCTACLTDANVADTLTVTKASNLTSDGFVKTSGGDGTLSVDTATYSTASSTDTVTNKTLDAEGTGNVVTIPFTTWYPVAGAVGSTGRPLWLSTMTAYGNSSGNGYKEYLIYTDAATLRAQLVLDLPADWTGAVDVTWKWYTDVGTAGDVVWEIETACAGDGDSNDPAWGTADRVVDPSKGTLNLYNDATKTGIAMAGCSAGDVFYFRLSRIGADDADTLAGLAMMIGARITVRRAI